MPLYAADAFGAAGKPLADLQSINVAISKAIGDDDVFVARDDAITNVNSLMYMKRRLHFGGKVGTPPFDRERRNPWASTLRGVVLTGRSCSGYHANVDATALERSLRNAHWAIIWAAHISSCNTIELWRAGRA